MSRLSEIGRYKVWIPAAALIALVAGIRALLWWVHSRLHALKTCPQIRFGSMPRHFRFLGITGGGSDVGLILMGIQIDAGFGVPGWKNQLCLRDSMFLARLILPWQRRN
jgi:hypothetical protein